MVKKNAFTESNYKRAITHTHYKHGNKKVKKGGLKGRLHTIITDNKLVLTKEWLNSKKHFSYASDNFLESVEPQKVTPLWGIGLSSFIIIICLFAVYKFPQEVNTMSFIIPFSFSLLVLLFFLVYYFTMPKKENIFNRKDGLITFPGFMWQKNITMSIKNIIFTMSGPSGVQGGSAYQLLIERPDIFYTKHYCFLGGQNCYEDLSFLLWYMDKNRPLPPGTAFDKYRQQDFERRKVEGFPKPLFPAEFDTPEATPEQQAERKRIGGW